MRLLNLTLQEVEECIWELDQKDGDKKMRETLRILKRLREDLLRSEGFNLYSNDRPYRHFSWGIGERQIELPKWSNT